MTTAVVPDKNTYAGQYASKRKYQKKMDFTQKEKIRVLHTQLGSLLATKKALNSKVTSRYFELFRECVESGADAYDIKNRLNRLEQALKQEGLFKNVKGEFVNLRKEIMGLLYLTEAQPPKGTLPGIMMAKDKTFYVPPKAMEPEPTLESSVPKHVVGSLSTDDMRVLNSAIGKLYRHLQIKEQESTRVNDFRDESTQKENVNILTLSHMHQDDTFHDMVLKIRNFEKEFQRQKVQQQRELMRLEEEVKRLNKNSNELRKENERMKGIQPIVTKAKGKQVERLEERYRNERKGMEEKIYELESGIKSKFQQLSSDKEEFREHVRGDVDSIVSSINNIHYMVLGHSHENRTINHRNYEDNEVLPTKEILSILTSVAGGVQVLKSKKLELEKERNRKTEDISAWRRGMHDLDREITRFVKSFAPPGEDREPTQFTHDDDPDTLTFSCKSKLQKAKDNINTKLKGITDSGSVIKSKEKDISKYKKNTEALQSEISKLHDHVTSVQRQDISIAMPTFSERRNDNSDGSADELPEADQLEQNDSLDKLRQIEKLVTHFQQLIIDRTSVLNKMENDMLPLKIRVNRLHEEISKAVNTGNNSPDPSEADTARMKRAFSPDNPSYKFSKEISGMLAKLSKMELTIRHLIEQHNSNDGRASI